jgi:hypothetical protein
VLSVADRLASDADVLSSSSSSLVPDFSLPSTDAALFPDKLPLLSLSESWSSPPLSDGSEPSANDWDGESPPSSSLGFVEVSGWLSSAARDRLSPLYCDSLDDVEDEDEECEEVFFPLAAGLWSEVPLYESSPSTVDFLVAGL